MVLLRLMVSQPHLWFWRITFEPLNEAVGVLRIAFRNEFWLNYFSGQRVLTAALTGV